MDGIKRALILDAVRWGAGTVATGVAVFCFSHTQIIAWVQQVCSLMTDQEAMEAGIPALAVMVATFLMGRKDVFGVDAKMTAAAAAGVYNGVALAHYRQQGADAQAQADQTAASAVQAAIDTAAKAKPADKAALLASLKAGSL